MRHPQNIAILYQAHPPPIKEGLPKPVKIGGYSDSGADIACELIKHGINVITPVDQPQTDHDYDWVFPDTNTGISQAIERGAKILWLNTVLYQGHAIENFFEFHIHLVGQWPGSVDIYDNKWTTNQLLKNKGIPIPEALLISKQQMKTYSLELDFPLVIKPIRGRGSQGVFKVETQEQLDLKLDAFFLSEAFGPSVYIEHFLSGQEITVTVLPPGNYQMEDGVKYYDGSWCLPAVKRFNHHEGIAPYNGIVAVTQNSAVLGNEELNSPQIKKVYQFCEKAANLLNIQAPIRMDWRTDQNGKYFLFDLNMKPNMTGPSRPHRKDQDSLCSIAARGVGWDYGDLLKNILAQYWDGRH